MKRSFWIIVMCLWLTLGAASAWSEPSLPPIKSSLQSSSLQEAVPRTRDNEDPRVSAPAPIARPAQAVEKLFSAVNTDYIIGAEDVLDISVWRNLDLSKVVQVRPDGRISIPVIRDVMAVGRTPIQLADEITARLREYVQNPIVAISVKEVNSYGVYLLGEVAKPGRYPLKSRTTLLQGLTMAGGFTPVAARNQVVVFRIGQSGDGEQVLRASYDEIVLGGGVSQNIELMAGDTIVVPSEAMVVFPGVGKAEDAPHRN